MNRTTTRRMTLVGELRAAAKAAATTGTLVGVLVEDGDHATFVRGTPASIRRLADTLERRWAS